MKNNKTLTIKEYELPVVIQKEKESGFSARCLQWQDCYAQGDSIEEVISEISYVASSLIELYHEEGLKVPLTLKKENSDSWFRMSSTFLLS